jgi:uncharacterized protein (DUF2062 family)
MAGPRGSGGRAIRSLMCLDWRKRAGTIVAIHATPRQIALGVALGSFIAFTPLIGLQIIIAALVATVLGASRKAAMLAVWISNPLTMGPIFALTYQLGLVLGSPEQAAASTAAPGEALVVIDGSTSIAAVPDVMFDNLLLAGWGYMHPMLLGGAVIGLLAAFLSYRLTYRGVIAYQSACERRYQSRFVNSASE